MKRLKRAWAITSLCLLIVGTTGYALTNRRHVDYWFCADGVVSSKGAPIEVVDVTLHIEGSSDDEKRPHKKTDSEGRFSFMLCCSGQKTPYSLSLLKSGFKPLTFESTSDCSAVRQIELVPDSN